MTNTGKNRDEIINKIAAVCADWRSFHCTDIDFDFGNDTEMKKVEITPKLKFEKAEKEGIAKVLNGFGFKKAVCRLDHIVFKN